MNGELEIIQQNLISVLLTYPHRRSSILDKNHKFIDEHFVERIETASGRMKEAGNHAAADFLDGLAAQIRREFLNVVIQVGEESLRASDIICRLTRYQLLPQFLSEIIIDQAIASLQCTPPERKEALQWFCQENKIKNEADRQAWCDHNGLTITQFEDLALRPLKIQKFQEMKWGNVVEAYFLDRKDDLDQVSYSLLRVKNGGLAQELYFRLEEGEQSFAQIARQYSQGPESQSGGLVGPMSLRMPHPLIAQKLKNSKPGQIIPPVQVEDWFIIVRLERLIPAKLDLAMRRRLLNELFQNWLSSQLNNQSIRLFSVTDPQKSLSLPAAVAA